MIQKSKLTGEPMVPVLYCDIDGTIRWGKDELGHFVNSVEDVRIFDGVPELLKGYKELGWRVVGVSNQGGIALDLITSDENLQMMMRTHILCGEAFDRLLWCSHHPNAVDPEMAVCWCRKPKAGLVIEAALSLNEQHDELYPPHLGLFVGDRPEDEGCAENAGLLFMPAAEWREGYHLQSLRDAEDA
ncbi:MAG TPA: hypothetical protein VN843_25745 [Anaerolineales bacterium]|nr:hypothetical protein [Anaerolineales bacterium]